VKPVSDIGGYYWKENRMTENTAAATPVRAISQTAARLSFAAAATFLVLLAALHFIKPELDPSWRMISEYEIGRYGWMMVLAFLSLALSCVALFVAIRSQIRTTGGYIGLVLLLVSALGMTIAAIFTTDPITASQDKLTTHGNLHGVGALLGIPTFPIAVTLVSLSLARNPAWSSARLGRSRWPESLRPDVLCRSSTGRRLARSARPRRRC
jgi:hypothetical protein